MLDERGSVSGEGGMHGKGGVVKGTCVARGHAWHLWWGRHAWQGACVAGETATAEDGTHPTGMHSCFNQFYSFFTLHFFLCNLVPF